MTIVHQIQLAGGLLVALVLGASIGAERRFRNNDAGLRTHALVALGAAGFVVVSKFGFGDTPYLDSTDPTRVAAQVVSGIGFLGGGVIFVRRDAVRGLTTASTIWLTAAVGMSAGAGLIAIAVALTLFHFVVVAVLPHAERLLPKPPQVVSTVTIAYPNHQGLLRDILAALTDTGWHVLHFAAVPAGAVDGPAMVKVRIDLSGRGTPDDIARRLAGLGPQLRVEFGDVGSREGAS